MAEAPPAENAPQAIDSRLALLREKGAERLDPVRFRFIEALARRAQPQRDEVRRILDDKLRQTLIAFEERLAQAGITAANTEPAATADDRQRLDAPQPENRQSPLAMLNAYLAQHSPESAAGSAAADGGARRELKAIRYFRNTWSTLSVDKQVAQAIAQGPENAGPLNSQRLVLQSLALMRDISPDYLKRFMSYADTLLALEQTDTKDKPVVKKAFTARKK